MRTLTVCLRRCWFFVLVSCVAFNPIKGDEPSSSEETKSILGTWQETSRKRGGEDRVKFHWDFKEGRVTRFRPERPSSVRFFDRFVLDEKSNPPHLDVIRTYTKQNETLIYPGICEWDGDRLKWCFSMNGTVVGDPEVEILRPKNFGTTKTGEQSNCSSVVLERVTGEIIVPEPKPDDQ